MSHLNIKKFILGGSIWPPKLNRVKILSCSNQICLERIRDWRAFLFSWISIFNRSLHFITLMNKLLKNGKSSRQNVYLTYLSSLFVTINKFKDFLVLFKVLFANFLNPFGRQTHDFSRQKRVYLTIFGCMWAPSVSNGVENNCITRIDSSREYSPILENIEKVSRLSFH